VDNVLLCSPARTWDSIAGVSTRIAKRIGSAMGSLRLSAGSTAVLVDAAARLRVACVVWIGLWTLGLVMNNLVATWVSPDRSLDDAWPYPANPVAVVVIGVSAYILVRLRPKGGDPKHARAALEEGDTLVPGEPANPDSTGRLARRVLNLALGYQVILAASIGLVNQWTPNTVGLSWIAILILVYPLIVPDSPSRTLGAALVAASMDPLGMLITGLRERRCPRPSRSSGRCCPTTSVRCWQSYQRGWFRVSGARFQRPASWAATGWGSAWAVAAWVRSIEPNTGSWRGRRPSSSSDRI
jgi:hypothetical protein